MKTTTLRTVKRYAPIIILVLLVLSLKAHAETILQSTSISDQQFGTNNSIYLHNTSVNNDNEVDNNVLKSEENTHNIYEYNKKSIPSNKEDLPVTSSKSIGDWFRELFSVEAATGPVSVGKPELTDVRATVGAHDVTISWVSNTLVLGRVYYSTRRSVQTQGESEWVSASNFANYANSKATIRDLTPKTKYYYKVVLKSFEGEGSVSEEYSFISQ